MTKRKEYEDDPVIVYESRDVYGNLQSVIQYVYPKKEKPSGWVIPKWFLGLASIYGIAILIGLISALFVIYFAPPPAFYQENCARRSCVQNFGFICKNQTCLCPNGYIFIDNCTLKKAFMEQCNLNSYCADNTSLICLNGKCSCSSTKYWNGKNCLDKISYGSSCKINDQCLDNLFLYCDPWLNQCACSNTTRLIFIKYFFLKSTKIHFLDFGTVQCVFLNEQLMKHVQQLLIVRAIWV